MTLLLRAAAACLQRRKQFLALIGMDAGLMHWFTSPYVHRLTYNSETGLTEVETLTLFAKYKMKNFYQTEEK